MRLRRSSRGFAGARRQEIGKPLVDVVYVEGGDFHSEMMKGQSRSLQRPSHQENRDIEQNPGPSAELEGH